VEWDWIIVEISMLGSLPHSGVVYDVHHVAFLSPSGRLRALMRERHFGAQVGIALEQRDREHFAEHLLKGLPINPEPLIVVTLSQGKSDQAHPTAPCESCVRGGVIKGCLQVAVVMLRAALEKRLSQGSQYFGW
jgi:hypothetical protein